MAKPKNANIGDLLCIAIIVMIVFVLVACLDVTDQVTVESIEVNSIIILGGYMPLIYI
jgi:di/tricarboxylate transporter